MGFPSRPVLCRDLTKDDFSQGKGAGAGDTYHHGPSPRPQGGGILLTQVRTCSCRVLVPKMCGKAYPQKELVKNIHPTSCIRTFGVRPKTEFFFFLTPTDSYTKRQFETHSCRDGPTLLYKEKESMISSSVKQSSWEIINS